MAVILTFATERDVQESYDVCRLKNTEPSIVLTLY